MFQLERVSRNELNFAPRSAATLRSSGFELLGCGFGSAALDQIKIAIGEFYQTAAAEPFQFNAKAVPLSKVESLWNSPQEGSRLVFEPGGSSETRSLTHSIGTLCSSYSSTDRQAGTNRGWFLAIAN